MSLAFITSLNNDLYQKYGKRFLEEFEKYAPDNIKIFVVFEANDDLKNLKQFSNKIEILPFDSEPPNSCLFWKIRRGQGT